MVRVKRLGWAALPLLAAAVLATAGEHGSKKGKEEAAALPVRSATGASTAKPVAGRTKLPPADNSACFVCHANYEDESMAATHAKEGTGCVDCHGQSSAHRNDEANVTPPDILYPARKIDAACRKCHEDHNAPATKVIARWQERCPGKTSAGSIVCTDCHGEHRLKNRTVRWDKQTRKLLEQPDADAKAPAR
jgi:hypothetical protein